MLLDDLVGVIETLKARIDDHGTVLRENETRTRMALIDPLLTALGWDTSDPALVTPEYSISHGRADYALRTKPDAKPVAVLEAKKLDEPLASHSSQMVTYALESGVAYAGLTNGDQWHIYNVFKPVPLADKRVLDVSIANTPAHEAVLKLLLLWRPNLASGQPVASNTPISLVPSDVPSDETNPPTPAPEPGESGSWISLANVEVGEGNSPPARIRFPGREPRDIKNWGQILVEVADRLSNDGMLRAADCPISGLGFINSSPAGTEGGTSGRYKKVSGGLYVNANKRATDIIRYSRKLLSHFGVDPATVELRFG